MNKMREITGQSYAVAALYLMTDRIAPHGDEL